MAEAAAHAAAIAQAIKASGVVVRVETPDFLRLLQRQDEAIVVRAPGGFFQASWRYLTTYKGWDEKPYSEGQDLPKLTRAAVTKSFTDDIAGEGYVEYLMMYRSDGSATFVGLERVVGRIAGRAGSFVLQRTGVFENGVAKESYSVIPGSGTGELRVLRGEGTSAVGHGTEHPLTLNYEVG